MATAYVEILLSGEKAAGRRAYNKAAAELFGEYAYPNIIS